MPEFKRRPTIVNAEQYFGYQEKLAKGVCFCHKQHNRLAHVHTVHDNQLVVVGNGDWIISEGGDDKHFYPCKPDIFEKIYELTQKK